MVNLMKERSQGRPLQCFTNVCKSDRHDCNIDATDWETMWQIKRKRNSVKEGRSMFEEKQREKAEERTL